MGPSEVVDSKFDVDYDFAIKHEPIQPDDWVVDFHAMPKWFWASEISIISILSQWKPEMENEPFGGTSTNVDVQYLYQPGLVQKRGRPYIRDPSDGEILVKDCHGKWADPVEVKARVSANTFHRTVNRFNQKHWLADMPGLSREACEVKCYQLKDDDEHLRGIVPESHDLFQVLHHA